MCVHSFVMILMLIRMTVLSDCLDVLYHDCKVCFYACLWSLLWSQGLTNDHDRSWTFTKTWHSFSYHAHSLTTTDYCMLGNLRWVNTSLMYSWSLLNYLWTPITCFVTSLIRPWTIFTYVCYILNILMYMFALFCYILDVIPWHDCQVVYWIMMSWWTPLHSLPLRYWTIYWETVLSDMLFYQKVFPDYDTHYLCVKKYICYKILLNVLIQYTEYR